jgi:hypothetical protein
MGRNILRKSAVGRNKWPLFASVSGGGKVTDSALDFPKISDYENAPSMKIPVHSILVACLAAATVACGGGACGTKGPVQNAPDAAVPVEGLLPPAPEDDPRGDALWAAAVTDGDDADFARLADYLGPAGLAARAGSKDHTIVFQALGYTEGWDAFRVLAEAVIAGDAREAALDGLLRLTSRPRLALDVEAPDELFAAADSLATWVGDGGGSKEERSRAVSALRRLVAWGWIAKPDLINREDAK